MRKKFFIIGTITAAACAAVSGCAEKKEGPQTIIIELADPTDIEESSMADESAALRCLKQNLNQNHLQRK